MVPIYDQNVILVLPPIVPLTFSESDDWMKIPVGTFKL